MVEFLLVDMRLVLLRLFDSGLRIFLTLMYLLEEFAILFGLDGKLLLLLFSFRIHACPPRRRLKFLDGLVGRGAQFFLLWLAQC